MKKRYIAIAACLALLGLSTGSEAKADSLSIHYSVSTYSPAPHITWAPVRVVPKPHCPPHAAHHHRKVFHSRHYAPPRYATPVRYVPHHYSRHKHYHHR